MKKLLALSLLAALLLCMTACSRDEERDLSALEEYTSGELRALMGDAMEVADLTLPKHWWRICSSLATRWRSLPLKITTSNLPLQMTLLQSFLCFTIWGGA